LEKNVKVSCTDSIYLVKNIQKKNNIFLILLQFKNNGF